MTVRDYLASALRLIGVLAPGESLSPDAYTDALQVFSDMLDAWSTERLTIFSQARTVHPLVAGTQRYSVGPDGDWDQAYPLWIDTVSYLTADGLEQNIDLFTRQQWAAITLKSQAGPLPYGVFYNPTFPLGAADVWPVPDDATVQVVLYAPSAALTEVTSLDTAISAPPGWARALRYNLADELYALYPDIAVVEKVTRGAIDSKAAIKRTNITLDELTLDPALTRGTGRWSIKVGEFV